MFERVIEKSQLASLCWLQSAHAGEAAQSNNRITLGLPILSVIWDITNYPWWNEFFIKLKKTHLSNVKINCWCRLHLRTIGLYFSTTQASMSRSCRKQPFPTQKVGRWPVRLPSNSDLKRHPWDFLLEHDQMPSFGIVMRHPWHKWKSWRTRSLVWLALVSLNLERRFWLVIYPSSYNHGKWKITRNERKRILNGPKFHFHFHGRKDGWSFNKIPKDHWSSGLQLWTWVDEASLA